MKLAYYFVAIENENYHEDRGLTKTIDWCREYLNENGSLTVDLQDKLREYLACAGNYRGEVVRLLNPRQAKPISIPDKSYGLNWEQISEDNYSVPCLGMFDEYAHFDMERGYYVRPVVSMLDY